MIGKSKYQCCLTYRFISAPNKLMNVYLLVLPSYRRRNPKKHSSRARQGGQGRKNSFSQRAKEETESSKEVTFLIIYIYIYINSQPPYFFPSFFGSIIYLFNNYCLILQN
jgi:hypothetical protein